MTESGLGFYPSARIWRRGLVVKGAGGRPSGRLSTFGFRRFRGERLVRLNPFLQCVLRLSRGRFLSKMGALLFSMLPPWQPSLNWFPSISRRTPCPIKSIFAGYVGLSRVRACVRACMRHAAIFNMATILKLVCVKGLRGYARFVVLFFERSHLFGISSIEPGGTRQDGSDMSRFPHQHRKGKILHIPHNDIVYISQLCFTFSM